MKLKKIEENIDKIKIILYSRDLFLKYGFHKISIGEIAKKMKISKNTIYKYFPAKNNLIEEILKYTSDEINENFQMILSSKINAVLKFIKVLEYAANVIMKFHDKFFKELRIYNPELSDLIEKIRAKYMYSNISKLIRQGKKEKLYKDYPDEVLITIFISIIKSVCNPEFIASNNFSLFESMKLSFEIFLNGILTAKGKKVFIKLKII